MHDEDGSSKPPGPAPESRPLADAIEQTLCNQQETNRRVAAARERVKTDLSFDTRTRKLENNYRAVLALAGKAPH